MARRVRLAAAALLCAVAAAAGASHDVSDEVLELRAAGKKCDRRVVTGPEPPKRWMVLSQQRSGSRWFVDTLSEYSEDALNHGATELSFRGGVGSLQFNVPDHEYCIHDKVSPRCSCAIRRMYQRPFQEHGKTAPGFKFMMDNGDWTTDRVHSGEAYAFRPNKAPAINAFAASVCALKIPFVFLLRRNVLRRTISRASNNKNRAAHVRSEAEAARARTFRPRLDAALLGVEIAREELENADLVAIFNYHCGGEDAVPTRVHYYEDLLDTAPGSARAWATVLYQLGATKNVDAARVERLRRDEPQESVIIHGSTPVNETISNFDEVAAILAGSPFEWMLWD